MAPLAALRAHVVLATALLGWRAALATPALARRFVPSTLGQALLALTIASCVLAGACVVRELVRRRDARTLVLAACAAASFGRRSGFDAFDLVYLLAVGSLALPAVWSAGLRAAEPRSSAAPSDG